MKRPVSTGQCACCQGTFPKASMTRHLAACLAKTATAAARPGLKPASKAFHLVVEGRYAPEYWLHLEVPAAATLDKLDQFLRAVWLECCGHMSAFSIRGARHSVSPFENPFFGGPRELDMKTKLSQVLAPGVVFEHEYDFGTTTHLKLKVVAERERAGGSADIRILARNHPPPILCEKCSAPAAQVCSQCIYGDEAWYCDNCAAEHACGEEAMLPVVNSPRVGMCGYTGGAF